MLDKNVYFNVKPSYMESHYIVDFVSTVMTKKLIVT